MYGVRRARVKTGPLEECRSYCREAEAKQRNLISLFSLFNPEQEEMHRLCESLSKIKKNKIKQFCDCLELKCIILFYYYKKQLYNPIETIETL